MENIVIAFEHLKQQGIMGYMLFAMLSIAGWVARSIASPKKTISNTQNIVGTFVIAIPVGTTTGTIVKGLEVSENFVSLQFIACYLSAVMSWNVVIYFVNATFGTLVRDIKKVKDVFKR